MIAQNYSTGAGNCNGNATIDISDYTKLVIGSVTSAGATSIWGNVNVSNDLSTWTALKTYNATRSRPDTIDISNYKYLGLQISGALTQQYSNAAYRDIEIS